MKDLTLKLTNKELLLLTEDNQDILKILKSRNLDPNNLFNEKQSLQQSSIMNLTNRFNVPQNEDLQQGLPEFVKKKYKKMV